MSLFLLALFACSTLFFVLGRNRAIKLGQQAGGVRSLTDLPVHYGCYIALLYALFVSFLFLLWQLLGPPLLLDSVMNALPKSLLSQLEEEHLLRETIARLASANNEPLTFEPVIRDAVALLHSRLSTGHILAGIVSLAAGFPVAFQMMKRLSHSFSALAILGRGGYFILIACSVVVMLIVAGILFAAFYEALRFFQVVPVGNFLFGLHWNPQVAIRPDQVASSGSFGVIPVLTGTLMVTVVAMCIAVPGGLLSAVWLTEYASRRWAGIILPLLEILMAIPTVVYGFFAFLFVVPLLHSMGVILGVSVAAGSPLAVGLVMGLMLTPYLSSLAVELVQAVPLRMKESSITLGATRFETLWHIVLPAAMPGIFASILLTLSRALGETMIVLMAGGFMVGSGFNPLHSTTTLTVQMVNLLVGNQGLDSMRTMTAFALGLLLLLFTLAANFSALHIVREYRLEYE